jgi:RNA polymerase sigma-70 factor (ECF subfamily)
VQLVTARHGASTRDEVAAQALAELDALYNLARYLTGNDADAEDLVQETYSRALAGADRFERGSNLKAWLFTIERHAFIDLWRKASRRPTPDGLEPGGTAGLVGAEETAPSEPERELVQATTRAVLEAALMTLPEDGRTVILLDAEGLTETEIGDVLGCPVGTVKSRLSRARTALRQRLAGKETW